jgi:hypothetical protein
MIYPKHQKFHSLLLHWYSEKIIQKQFHSVHIQGELQNTDKSCLVIGNHSSWWDGFWMLHLNEKILGKKFHVMMLERELKKHMFFNKCGAYSINPGNISVRQSLETTWQLLSHSNNMVLFYPEGVIHTQTSFPKKFEKGIVYILKNFPENAQLIFSVCLTDYFSHKKPSLFIYFKAIGTKGIQTHLEMEQAYNNYFKACIDHHNKRLS